MDWSLDQPQSQLHYDRHAQATRAYASQGQPASQTSTINSLIHKSYGLYIIIGRYGERETDPMIQIMTPMMERRRERKAKGRPRRKPRGRHSQSSPQHMASAFFFFFFLLLVYIFYVYLPLFRKRKTKPYNLGVGTIIGRLKWTRFLPFTQSQAIISVKLGRPTYTRIPRPPLSILLLHHSTNLVSSFVWGIFFFFFFC